MAQSYISQNNFYFSQTPAKIPGRRILRVAHEKWSNHYQVKRQDSIGVGLAIILKGKCFFETENKKWILSKGTIAAFGPGQNYSITADQNSNLELFLVSYCGKELIDLTDQCLGGTCLAVQIENYFEILKVFESIFDQAKERLPYSENICLSLIPILLWLIKREITEHPNNFSDTIRKFNECKYFIDKNFKTIKSIDSVAKKMKISHVHLCRLFKKFEKVSPNLYLTKLKVNYAAHIVQFSDLPIKTIAMDLGFQDQFIFSKTFKRILGLSPKSFRIKMNSNSS